MKRVLTVAAFLGLAWWAVDFSRPLTGQDKPAKAKEPEAEAVLQAWAAPGAPKNRRTTWPRGHNDLAKERYTVEQPFQKVWEFYVAKCGGKEKYKAGLTLQSGGGDKQARYMFDLSQNPKAPGNGYCQFAVHAETFWVVVEIGSDDLTKAETSVSLIAGAR